MLEGAVSRGPYLVGDAFTAADLYLGSQLGFGLQFGMIEKRPAFVEYVARLTTRPAAVRAKEIDDALAPATSPLRRAAQTGAMGFAAVQPILQEALRRRMG